jgi:nitroreductase
VLPAVEQVGEAPAVYHYAPKEHALERRAILDAKAWGELSAPPLDGAFLVGLSSVHWREVWKYGERAFRYCQHDAGHALASLRIAAAALGWGLLLLSGYGDSAIANLLGLRRADDYGAAEHEEPGLLAWVAAGPAPPPLLNGVTAVSSSARWYGRANSLSLEHGVEWPVIDEVSQATRRSERAPITEGFAGFPMQEEIFATPIRRGLLTAEKAILGRRSAVAMDGETAIPQETFFRMLARLMPTNDGGSVPWDAIAWRPRIHLGLFVHHLFWEAGMVGQVLYLEAAEAGIRATGIGCYFDDAVHEVFGIDSREWQSLYHFTVGCPVEDGRLTATPAYA